MPRDGSREASWFAWLGFAAGTGSLLSLFPAFALPAGAAEDLLFVAAGLGVATLICWGLWGTAGDARARRWSRPIIGVGVLLASFGLAVFFVMMVAATAASN